MHHPTCLDLSMISSSNMITPTAWADTQSSYQAGERLLSVGGLNDRCQDSIGQDQVAHLQAETRHLGQMTDLSNQIEQLYTDALDKG